MSTEQWSYKNAGVDIDTANAAKQGMSKVLAATNQRVLNTVGAFASLYDIHFPAMTHPVLVLKTEEPGSKQLLALQHDRAESICFDMINHLINDCVVMGATPLAVQDAIICGKLEQAVVMRMVKAIAEACRQQGCELTGGETSEQPGMLEAGRYVLTSSIVGIVERDEVIDGSAIQEGDVVLGLESSGLHTNGYTLIRAIIAKQPDIIHERLEDGRTFLDAILEPHRCYYQAIKDLFPRKIITGMAHITGGGIRENLNRVLPAQIDAEIDLSEYPKLPIFSYLKNHLNIGHDELLRTFNMGIGYVIVTRPNHADEIIRHIQANNIRCNVIGTIVPGQKTVRTINTFAW